MSLTGFVVRGPCLAAMTLMGVLLGATAVGGEPAGPPPQATVAPIAPMSQPALIERQRLGDAELFLLDVRSPEEFAAGHVPGAVNIPHDQLLKRLADVPKDADVVLYCRSGHRSALAAEVLLAHGYQRLAHLEGDMDGWVANGRPVESTPPKR
ncbi:MAG TPA: rhodanese-like domain-containing protein [Steroidobacteraceae bacterium]|nr:rhodanese-like domain-containing protein [Steroidobacteraceae bacterium]